jgi:hypothetical protein
VPRRAGAYAAATLAVAWLVTGVALVGGLALEALTLSDKGCRVAAIDAVGEVSWQGWPPGEVCTYLGVRISEPPAWRGWLIIAEVVVGIVLLVAWRRYRDAPDPDWTE